MAVRKETKVGQVDLPLEALDGDMPTISWGFVTITEGSPTSSCGVRRQ